MRITSGRSDCASEIGPGAVVRFADDFHVRLENEPHSQTLSYSGLVVYQQDLDGLLVNA